MLSIIRAQQVRFLFVVFLSLLLCGWSSCETSDVITVPNTCSHEVFVANDGLGEKRYAIQGAFASVSDALADHEVQEKMEFLREWKTRYCGKPGKPFPYVDPIKFHNESDARVFAELLCADLESVSTEKDKWRIYFVRVFWRVWDDGVMREEDVWRVHPDIKLFYCDSL